MRNALVTSVVQQSLPSESPTDPSLPRTASQSSEHFPPSQQPSNHVMTTTSHPPTGQCQRLLLKNIALLWTGEGTTFLSGASIFIDNGFIQWVGSHDQIPSSYLTTDHIVEDMSNRLITPGLINTHHHMYQSLTKCIARESELFDWLTSLFPIWQHLTPDMVYKSARFSIAELLLSGCTTTTDHLYLYPNGVRLDDTIRAARELGIRFQPTRGAVSVGASNGGLPPDVLVEDEAMILADMKRLIDQYHESHDGAMLRIALAPCSPFSVSRQLMIETAQLARRHSNVMLHTHLAENSSDMRYMDENLQQTVPQFLESCEWNRADCWFAHCVKLSADDGAADECGDAGLSSLQYFAKRGLGVAHCPSSNARLASGMAPIREMLDAKVSVGIGVDGSASNDSGNLLAEARQALLTARLREERPDAMSAVQALQIATVGGAQVMGRSDVGLLRAGMCADVVGWRLDAPAFAGALHSNAGVLAAVVLGHGGDLKADLVVVNGRIVVRKGDLTGTNDFATITKEHNAAALELKNKAGKIMM